MVESHEVEDGCVHVVDVDAVLDGRQSKFVGGAVAESFLHTAAGHPGGVAVVVVVATLLTLRSGGAAKFTAPDDERLVEQAAAFEIFQERGDSLVAGLGKLCVTAGDVAVTRCPRQCRSRRSNAKAARRARPPRPERRAIRQPFANSLSP